MELHKLISGSALVRILMAVALIAAYFKMPYDFYRIMRWIVTGGLVYLLFLRVDMQETWKRFWILIFLLMIIIFNPIVPLHLKRETWQFADPLSALILLVSIVFFREQVAQHKDA